MGDPSIKPPDWLVDGEDPRTAPKYLEAKELLSRPGKSAEFTRTVDGAVQRYEQFYAIDDGGGEETAPESVEQQATAEVGRDMREQMSFGEGLGVGASDAWNLGDTARGLGASVASLTDQTRPEGRTVGPGTRADQDTRPDAVLSAYAAIKNAQFDQDKARDEAPWGYRLGQMAAETAATAPAMEMGSAELAHAARVASLSGKAATPVRNMAAIGAGIGAPQGAASAIGASRDYKNLDQKAVTGAFVGGGAGALGGMGAYALGRGARTASEYLGRKADLARANAPGPGLETLAMEEGKNYPRQLGQFIEQQGLHEPVPGQTNAFKRAGEDTYFENAKALAGDLGAQLGEAVDEATQAGAHYPKADLINKMRAVKARYTEDTGGLERRKIDRLIAYVQDKTGTLSGKGGKLSNAKAGEGDLLSARELQEIKLRYEAEAGYAAKGKIALPRDQKTATMYRRLAGAPRSGLDEALKLGTPETLAKYQAARGPYGMAQDVVSMSAKPAAARYAGQEPARGLRDAISNVSTNSNAGILNQIPGARAAAKFVGNHATSPEAMRTYQKGANAIDNMATTPTGVPRAPWAAPVAAQQGGQALRQLSSPTGSVTNADAIRSYSYATRGHDMDDKVYSALDANPEAFGSHSKELIQARDSGDDDKMRAAIVSLQSDPEFQTKYLPQLQQR